MGEIRMKEKGHIKMMLIVVIIILSMINLVVLFKMTRVEDYSQETFRGDEFDQAEVAKISNNSLVDALDKFQTMHGDPNSFKDAELVFPAIIFTQPTTDGQRTHFQCFAYDDEGLNTSVYADGVLDFKKDDVVLIKGKVLQEKTFQNIVNETRSIPQVWIDSVVKTDYVSAFYPAIKTMGVDQTIDQEGIRIQVSQVAVAEEESRVSLRISNNTTSKMTYAQYGVKLVQGDVEYAVNTMVEANNKRAYNQIQKEIYPGVIETGTVVFDPINLEEPFTLYLEAYLENDRKSLQPFIYEIEKGVEFPARVSILSESDGQNTYFQCHAYDDTDFNTLIHVDGMIDLKKDDVVLIKGKVTGQQIIKNAFGSDLSLAEITADSIEKLDSMSAFSPAIKTIPVDQTIDQGGYKVRISKIEISEDETRLYVSAHNNTKEAVAFYTSEAKVVQGTTQFAGDFSYLKGYQEISIKILPGITEEGIIVFDKINYDKPFTIYLKGEMSYFNDDFGAFVFEIE